MRRSVIVLSFLLSACLSKSDEWGSARAAERFRQLKVGDIRSAIVFSGPCKEKGVPVDRKEAKLLLATLAQLTPIDRIGAREPWQTERIVELDCGAKGRYEISLASRPSLHGRPVTIVKGGIRPDEFLDFFEGEALRSCLATASVARAQARPCP